MEIIDISRGFDYNLGVNEPPVYSGGTKSVAGKAWDIALIMSFHAE
jgi:hypothetical protein